jgi:GAF domain-containing protein
VLRRRAARLRALILEDDTIAALERIHAGQLLENALAYFPADQAEAVQARIVDERAVLALGVVALPRGDGAGDVEIPAVPPPTTTSIEAAYGVFRRPERDTDRVKLKQPPLQS